MWTGDGGLGGRVDAAVGRDRLAVMNRIPAVRLVEVIFARIVVIVPASIARLLGAIDFVLVLVQLL